MVVVFDDVVEFVVVLLTVVFVVGAGVGATNWSLPDLKTACLYPLEATSTTLHALVPVPRICMRWHLGRNALRVNPHDVAESLALENIKPDAA